MSKDGHVWQRCVEEAYGDPTVQQGEGGLRP